MSFQDYHSRVRDLGCIICKEMSLGFTPAAIHHVESIRDGLSEYAVIPLCYDHHQGPEGVHGLRRKVFEMRYRLTDVDMMALVNKALHKA